MALQLRGKKLRFSGKTIGRKRKINPNELRFNHTNISRYLNEKFVRFMPP
jgi:hypothetical protein